MADARMRPDEIDYVCAHGSSTRQNDINETAAIKKALGKHAYKVAVSSFEACGAFHMAQENARTHRSRYAEGRVS